MMTRKLESVFSLTGEEKQAILKLSIHTMDFRARQKIVRMGDIPNQCSMILEGFTCAYKNTIEDKRQILALYIPGDMPDLQSLHLSVMDITIAAISPCTLGFIQHDDLRRLCERFPRFTAVFWHETLVHSSICREWLLNIGQRNAYSRIAHLICELKLRMKAEGLAEEKAFFMPITQSELADATGLTQVYVNRVMQMLRADGLIITEKQQITVPDINKLQEASEFDPLYLHLEKKTIA